jgi:hypothetical protein
MELGNKNWTLIVVLAIVISIIVVVIALVIYDNTMTPNSQQEQIDNINSYLSRLIVGYTTA